MPFDLKFRTLSTTYIDMPPLYFPLRWESTGDQWWYACPIDYAAANGHYESTRELIRLDTNNLIKFTSLRRIRRLETVWDDNEQFHDVAKHRSQVAQKLYIESESKYQGNKSLVRAGYGGWLLYTAASAGDLSFVQELLLKHPLLVFGEGEYGVTDILYAAAKSKSFQVFKIIFDYATSPRFTGGEREVNERGGEVPSAFKTEMINRAMHASARGGNVQVLKHLLQSYCSDLLGFRDVHGSTILHAAASKGHVQVVEHLTSCFDIINATDNQGNTALHIAGYKGQLGVVKALVEASPSIIFVKNHAGESFLHMAVSGFKTHVFRRMDHQTHFMKQLVSEEIFNVKEIINDKNTSGRTALHQAIIGNIHSDLVQLLMTVGSIDVNARDSKGMTPLDHLRHQPASAFSDRVIKDLVSAGGVCSSDTRSVRRNMVCHLREQATATSPGTSFKVSDAEILLNTGQAASLISKSDTVPDSYSEKVTLKPTDAAEKKLKSVTAGAHGFKRMLLWPKVDNKRHGKQNVSMDVSSIASTLKQEISTETIIPLRQRFSKTSPSLTSSPSNNKRPLAVRSNQPSPAAKKKLASGLANGVMQSVPLHFSRHSRSSSFSQISIPSPKIHDKQTYDHPAYEVGCSSISNILNEDDDVTPRVTHRQGSLKYLCFGAPSLCGKDPAAKHHHHHQHSRSDTPVA